MKEKIGKKEVVLISGPMKSGKSARLIEMYNDFSSKGITVECFKNSIDTRDVGYIKSRAYDETVPCTTLNNIKECINSKADVVMIDEFQFIQAPIMADTVRHFIDNNRSLYIFGLDRIADGSKWPTYTAIKDLVDAEIQLKADCEMCGRKGVAEYTKLESQSNDLVQIENELVKYYPVCKDCFLKKQ